MITLALCYLVAHLIVYWLVPEPATKQDQPKNWRQGLLLLYPNKESP